MEINIYYDLASLLISVLLLVYFGTTKKTSDIQNKIFFMLILFNGLTSAFDISEKVGIYLNAHAPFLSVMNMGYFITHLSILPCLFFYILNCVKNWYELEVRFRVLISIPAAISFFFVLTNPLTNFIFYYDGDTYCRGNGYIVLYTVIAVYFLCLLYVLSYYKDYFSTFRRGVFYLTIGIIVSSIVIQFINPLVRLETFAITYCLLIMFFFTQNPHDQVDKETGMYNKYAFTSLMTQNISKHMHIDIVELILDDFDDVARNMEVDSDYSLACQITDYLLEIDSKATVFRYEKNVFCFEVENPMPGETDNLIETIRTRFSKAWHYKDYDILYKTKLCKISLPEDVSSISGLCSILGSSISKISEKDILQVEDFDLLALERKLKISTAIVKAFEDNLLELVYTPICKVTDKKIVGVEISSRFLDGDVGYVYENDIISHVERNGQILVYARNVVEKMCSFFKHRSTELRGIEYIFVRIPSIVCIQSGFIDSMIDAIIASGVNPNNVVFEVSEFMVSRALDALEEIMPKLQKKGFVFCLEDYGSGFTNLASIYDLPFDMLMVESTVVMNAFKNEKAKITLRRTLELAVRLEMRTMIGGINDKELFDMITEMSCDYAKGTYFLDGISENEFIEIINEQIAGNEEKSDNIISFGELA